VIGWGCGGLSVFGEFGVEGTVKEDRKYSKDKLEPLRRAFSVFGSIIVPRKPAEYRARS
jgi:hypothetical protein